MTSPDNEQLPAGGIPASGAGPLFDLIANDPPPEVTSAYTDLLDQALAAPRVHTTRVERWIDEPNTLAGGRWVEVES